jgi:putative restriction endonuclease
MKAAARELLDRINNLNVGQSVDRRAPHKPLLLLLAISGIQKQLPRLRNYVEIEGQLSRALAIFGRPAKRQNPQYPFWRLQNDKLWQVESDAPMSRRVSNTDPPRSQLVAKRARGGLASEYYDALFGNEELQTALIHQLLDGHFPASTHEDIIAYFDLEVGNRVGKNGNSESAFRRAVLQAYNSQCAVSGYATAQQGFPLGVEAAYIKWPQSGGSSEVSNGIALNTLHRKLFDLGLFTITPQFRVRVSCRASGPQGFEEFLKRFDGRRLNVPSEDDMQPSTQALAWHASEVFRR